MCVPEFCFRGSFPYCLLFEIGHREITRLTNAFSKKIENHCHAIALHFVYYNFVKLHKTLRVTPAMAAGLTKRFMSIEDIVNLVPEPEAKKRGSYKRKEPLNKRFFIYLMASKGKYDFMNKWKIYAVICALFSFGALKETFRILTSNEPDIAPNRIELVAIALPLTALAIFFTIRFWKKSKDFRI